MSKQTALEVLSESRELLDSKDRWCQVYVATTKDGRPTDIYSEDAASWCLAGSLTKCDEMDLVLNQKINHKILYCIRGKYPDCGFKNIADFNDRRTTTHEDILEILDMAIEMEKTNIVDAGKMGILTAEN